MISRGSELGNKIQVSWLLKTANTLWQETIKYKYVRYDPNLQGCLDLLVYDRGSITF